ncbi:hypothetical protein BV25DRAFT_1563377 [Artomyces pyxidatus]|uniref:Uncharacterized protein n=1 Tax=Artomyces pyxidatus TaxID=48021 RepID=A0ACB8SJW7_9AGAM|nr:hypothetical protein BV25DRAFT_1563377 [Artomyces pyxidatus]
MTCTKLTSMPDLSALEKKIAEAEGKLLALRRLKNSQAPISRLPVEVLTRIFSCFQASRHNMHTSPSCPPAWVAVTHVCHHWRNVALSCPSLWTNVVLLSPSWASEMLNRSLNTPISIILDYDPEEEEIYADDHVVKSALARARRAKEIVLRGDYLQDNIRPLFRRTAPLLEKLELWDHNRPLSLRKGDLFLGQTPKLRSLKLRSCLIDWKASMLFSPTITRLRLEDVPEQDRATHMELRDILAALPNLQNLTLLNALQTSSKTRSNGALSDAQHRLPFPHLKSVNISAVTAQDVSAVVSCISAPMDAGLRIECEKFTAGRKPSSSAGCLASCLASFFSIDLPPDRQRALTSNYDAIGFAHSQRGHSFIAGNCFPRLEEPYDMDSNDPLTFANTQWTPKVYLQINRHPSQDCERDIYSLFKVACAILPLSDVNTAFVDNLEFYTPETWWQMFGKMDNIEEVVVATGEVYDGFLAAMAGKGRPSAPFPPDDLFDDIIARHESQSRKDAPLLPHLFPKLMELALEGIDLGWETTFEDLFGVLSFRCFKRNGMNRLETLRLHRCDVHAEHLIRLAGVVAQHGVDWDRVRDGAGLYESITNTFELADEDSSDEEG